MIFRTWTWINHLAKNLAVWLSMLSMSALIIVLLVNITCRYLLNIPVPWANELASYLFAWITFMGATLGVQKNNMAAVSIIVERLKGMTLKVTHLIIQLLVLAFSVIFLYVTYLFFTSPTTYNTISPSLNIPIWIPYLILPISFLFIFIFCVDNMIKALKD